MIKATRLLKLEQSETIWSSWKSRRWGDKSGREKSRIRGDKYERKIVTTRDDWVVVEIKKTRGQIWEGKIKKMRGQIWEGKIKKTRGQIWEGNWNNQRRWGRHRNQEDVGQIWGEIGTTRDDWVVIEIKKIRGQISEGNWNNHRQLGRLRNQEDERTNLGGKNQEDEGTNLGGKLEQPELIFPQFKWTKSYRSTAMKLVDSRIAIETGGNWDSRNIGSTCGTSPTRRCRAQI